jgi:hypothetical protein
LAAVFVAAVFVAGVFLAGAFAVAAFTGAAFFAAACAVLVAVLVAAFFTAGAAEDLLTTLRAAAPARWTSERRGVVAMWEAPVRVVVRGSTRTAPALPTLVARGYEVRRRPSTRHAVAQLGEHHEAARCRGDE